jgi:hypothetical protein
VLVATADADWLKIVVYKVWPQAYIRPLVYIMVGLVGRGGGEKGVVC